MLELNPKRNEERMLWVMERWSIHLRVFDGVKQLTLFYILKLCSAPSVAAPYADLIFKILAKEQISLIIFPAIIFFLLRHVGNSNDLSCQ